MARQDTSQRAYLSNEQLQKLTGWDRRMTEDYQGIQRDTSSLFTDADEFELAIQNNANNIQINADDISTNADNIQTNADDIQTNSDNIQTNTGNIQINVDNILSLEFRVFGDVRPDGYDDTTTTYNPGDFVVDPDADPQNYYQALVLMTLPAGAFVAANWRKISLVDLALEITELEFRVFGSARPAAYDDTSTSYSPGDYVVNPSSGLQNYYQNEIAVAAPAGVFNALLWRSVSLRDLAIELVNLEFRVFGEVRPAVYDDTSTSYSIGDKVVNPNSALQNYYIAKIAIPAPAGAFNASAWKEKSLINSVTFDDIATPSIYGVVKKMALVNNAIASVVSVVSPDVLAAPVAYSQVHIDTIVSLINELKAGVNQLVVDVNLDAVQFNELLTNSKLTDQMSSI